ncbi:MAG: hypothetical protein JWL98_2245, partial [Xanthomonadaceae bacterium]|nr:hypothetical protein [Xanthomonadaceae bacterium]
NASTRAVANMGDAGHAPGVASRRWERLAAPALRAAAVGWYCAAMAGQLFFAVYIVAFFWNAAAHGRPDTWNQVLSPGYVAGDTVGNVVLASHLLFAVAVTVGGLLQLVQRIRQRRPAFHRWNGRVFLLSAVIASVGGLVMVWTRKTGGDLSQHLGISLMALLILGFAAMTLRHAMARRFDLHRRYALRLFLVVSGGWFFRVGLMLWIVANQGPAGFDPKTFTGPFLTFLSFADYLVPLALLELYFRAQQSLQPRTQLAMAGGLGVVTLAMTGGIAAAAAILWLPHL